MVSAANMRKLGGLRTLNVHGAQDEFKIGKTVALETMKVRYPNS